MRKDTVQARKRKVRAGNARKRNRNRGQAREGRGTFSSIMAALRK